MSDVTHLLEGCNGSPASLLLSGQVTREVLPAWQDLGALSTVVFILKALVPQGRPGPRVRYAHGTVRQQHLHCEDAEGRSRQGVRCPC